VITDVGEFSRTNTCALTTYQPDTKSNLDPNPTAKQHAIVNI